MIRFFLLAVAFTLLIHNSPMAAESTKPPAAIPLSVAVKNAASIVILSIKSARLNQKKDRAIYECDLVQHVSGKDLNMLKLEGPVGMKIGKTYVAFLRVDESDVPQNKMKDGRFYIMGSTEPTAFQVEQILDKNTLVYLNNRRIIPPRFPTAIEVKQTLVDDNESSQIILGTFVPLIDFVEFIKRSRVHTAQ